MKTLLVVFCIMVSGCSTIKNAKPVFNVYGESDYSYVRIGLMWGMGMTNYVNALEEDDFLRGDSGSDKGSKGRGSIGGGSCNGGSCRDK